MRVGPGGAAIETEVWALCAEGFGGFVAGIPAPLCVGTLLLADGTTPKGFLCEIAGLDGARDITQFGGWRAYRAAAPSLWYGEERGGRLHARSDAKARKTATRERPSFPYSYREGGKWPA